MTSKQLFSRLLAICLIIGIGLPLNSPMSASAQSSSTDHIIMVASGGLRVLRDGSMVPENGAEIVELPSDDRQQEEQIVEVESGEIVVVPNRNPSVPRVDCYTHTASNVAVGDTYYKRETDYCVNDSGNEVVRTMKYTNTGSEYTPTFLWRGLMPCGAYIATWSNENDYRLGPGAWITFEPWHEIPSGTLYDGQIWDDWTGLTKKHCLPDYK